MEGRARKRPKLTYVENGDQIVRGRGHQFGNIDVGDSAAVHIGDRIYNEYRNDGVDKDAKLYSELLDSLPFERIHDRMLNVRTPLLKTCQWLFSHPTYRAWEAAQDMHNNNGFLWIRGKPGCGKSTLMKAALKRAERLENTQPARQIKIHYFFHARAAASLEKSSLGLYRSLVHQLLQSCPHLRDLFTSKFALKKQADFILPWGKEELQDFLNDLVESGIKLTIRIFIDALDEAEYEEDVREMINFLVSLSERALEADSSCRLHICLSSRHYPHISVKKGSSLVVEDQPEHMKDIEKYIDQKLNDFDGVGKAELSAKITKRSANIFLWVVLVVDILNPLIDRGARAEDMQAYLETIPSDLDKLFKEILLKSSYGIEDSIALFQWMLFSFRALTPQELYLGIRFSRSPGTSSKLTHLDLYPPPLNQVNRYILNCSRGLVETTSGLEPVVQFIHETVREFLMSANGLASVLPALAVNVRGLSHEILRLSCFRYVLTNMTYVDIHLPDSSFLEYADRFAFHHADHAQWYGVNQTAFLRSQMDGQGMWLQECREWWHKFNQPGDDRRRDGAVTLLYLLVEEGLASLALALLETFDNAQVNFRCGQYGTALHAACKNGQSMVVRALLVHGADTSAPAGRAIIRGLWYNDVVETAIIYRQFTLIPMLMQYGASITPERLNNLLANAVMRCSSTEVKTFLQLGADPNTWMDSGPLLCLAAEMDFAEAVQALVHAKADLLKCNIHNNTALHIAAQKDHTKVIKILVDGGVDIDAVGAYGYTALRLAVFHDALQSAAMLLDLGATVSSVKGYYDFTAVPESIRHKISGVDSSRTRAMLRARGAKFTDHNKRAT